MTSFPTRLTGAWLIAAIVASWPSALAALLLKVTVLAGHGALSATLAGMAISSIISAALGWMAWPSARAASGLWGLYGILVGFPICSIWTAIAEATRSSSRALDVAGASVGILLFAAPFVVIIGLLVGADVAFILGWVGRVRDRKGVAWGWYAISLALAVHYAAGLALAVVGKVWA